jgi:hypothetical protein
VKQTFMPDFLLIAVLLAGIPASGEIRTEATAAPAVTLFAHFDGNPGDVLLEALHKELSDIMRVVGFQVEWRDLDRSDRTEVVSELVVIKFKGRCSMDPSFAALTAHSGPLGWTHVTDGEILPYIDVQCDRIQNVIGPEVLRFEPAERKRRYSRAMARVAAHELYHVLGKTSKHAMHGIAKRAYDVKDLLSDGVTFETDTISNIHRRTPRPEASLAAVGGG